MTIEEIRQYFAEMPATHIRIEQAICYILSVLLQGDSYGTELIQKLRKEYPCYDLSDTVLYAALKFLESEDAIASYLMKVPEGRGRPRHMYQIKSQWQSEALKLASLWNCSVLQQQMCFSTGGKNSNN